MRDRFWRAGGAFLLPLAVGACADGPANPAVASVVIISSSLPSGVRATPYAATLTAAGGSAPYTWSVESGTLPTGLTLSSSGTIAGTPAAGGVYTFTGRVSSGSQSDTRDLAILISDPPRLRWPLEGANGVDWVVNNYVDLDPTGRLRDYTGSTGGSAKTYDTHAGVDIDVPNFRWMDSSLSPVHAAAAGVVTATHDGEWDRNMSCTGVANMVTIRHADGSSAIYYHFKRGSLTVAVGQSVMMGDRIGLVGSSGCSTAPHLHFELRDASNRVIDPFQSGLWIDPPPYDAPLHFMDGVLHNGAFTPQNFAVGLTDPAPNVASLPSGATLGFGAILANGVAGDEVRVVVRNPANTATLDLPLVFTGARRHGFYYWNAPLAAVGRWTVSVNINGVLVRTFPVTVTP